MTANSFGCSAAQDASARPAGQRENQRLLGEYEPVEPRRPGLLSLRPDGSFLLQLPTGLLDDGEPFTADGMWRPRRDVWADLVGLDPVVVLDVARWGAETPLQEAKIPLYSHDNGLSLMSPCMTWVFQPRAR